MGIREISLENFKALEKTPNITFGRITVLIGGNGSGKSSILQALGLLKQSRQQRDFVLNGIEVRAGEYVDIVTSGATRRQLRFSLVVESSLPEQLFSSLQGSYLCNYTFQADAYGAVRQEAHYEFPDKVVKGVYDFKTNRGDVTPSELTSGVQLRYSGPVIGSVMYVDVSNYQLYYKEAVSVRDIVINALENSYFVPIERALKDSSYQQQIAPLDFRKPDDIANFLVYKQDAREKVSELVSAVLSEELEIDFHRSPSGEGIALETKRKRETFNIAHEGSGLQNILWPLVQVVAAPDNALITIEEPEIHLHPKAQGDLGEVLLRSIKQENKQLLLTTQSEHLLLGLLIQVAEGQLAPEELAIYYFDKQGSTTQIIRLSVQPDGSIEGGLRGFYETNFDQLARFTEASARAIT